MKIALLGDVALFGAFSQVKNQDLDSNLTEISNYLNQFDYVIGNLETPFSIKRKTYGAKSAYISANKDDAEILTNLHISHVNLANNHIYDFGNEGYETTISVLNEVGIKHFGTDGRSCVICDNDSKLLLNGFCCYSSNPLGVATQFGMPGVNPMNLQIMEKILKEQSDKGFFNLFSIHSGMEHVHFPSTDLIKVARQLSRIAPFIFYGHHPHVIQGQELINSSLVSYSLGNFCFDDVYNNIDDIPLITLSKANRTGLIVELEINNNKVIKWSNTLIEIKPSGEICIIGKDATLDDYSQPLISALSDIKYAESRSHLINAYIQSRKNRRNLIWYIKRLRPRYVKIILNARRNKILYHKNVSALIKQHSNEYENLNQ